MPNKHCFIVGEIGPTQSRERKTAMWLIQAIVDPVLKESFPDFELRHVDMVLEQEHINKEILDNLTHAELVIANLSVTILRIRDRHDHLVSRAPRLPQVVRGSTCRLQVARRNPKEHL